MKIPINREQKIKLLQAIMAGIFDSKIFPELYNCEPARTLTKKEAGELLNDLDAGNFDKVRM